MLQNAVINILAMGVGAFVTTTAALMVVAAREKKPVAQPVNAISHMFFGDRSFDIQGPVPRYFLTGLGLNLAALIGWAAVAELALRVLNATPQTWVNNGLVAAGTTVLAWIVDFHVVPKRLTPGFENVLTTCGLRRVYVVLAATLFATAFYRI